MTFDNVFSAYNDECWPYLFSCTLRFTDEVRGGVPSDPEKAYGWINSKIKDSDSVIQQMVAQAIVERGLTQEQAVKYVNELKNLQGFKRDETGLYIEGRQLKAALKEACVVALSSNKIVNKGFGLTAKSLKPYLAEHVMVPERRLHLKRNGEYIQEADGIDQKFVHTYNVNAINYEEYVTEAEIDFTLKSDHPFTRQEWAIIFLTGGDQGLGASRSQGHGKYIITKFEQVKGDLIPESGSSSGKNKFGEVKK